MTPLWEVAHTPWDVSIFVYDFGDFISKYLPFVNITFPRSIIPVIINFIPKGCEMLIQLGVTDRAMEIPHPEPGTVQSGASVFVALCSKSHPLTRGQNTPQRALVVFCFPHRPKQFLTCPVSRGAKGNVCRGFVSSLFPYLGHHEVFRLSKRKQRVAPPPPP